MDHKFVQEWGSTGGLWAYPVIGTPVGLLPSVNERCLLHVSRQAKGASMSCYQAPEKRLFTNNTLFTQNCRCKLTECARSDQVRVLSTRLVRPFFGRATRGLDCSPSNTAVWGCTAHQERNEQEEGSGQGKGGSGRKQLMQRRTSRLVL